MEEAGLEFNGVLRVWTNAQPTKHNSKNVRPQGQLIVYTRDIENVRQKVPLFKFVPEIQRLCQRYGNGGLRFALRLGLRRGDNLAAFIGSGPPGPRRVGRL